MVLRRFVYDIRLIMKYAGILFTFSVIYIVHDIRLLFVFICILFFFLYIYKYVYKDLQRNVCLSFFHDYSVSNTFANQKINTHQENMPL